MNLLVSGQPLSFVDSILERRLDGAIGYFLNECKKQDKLERQYLAKILQVKLPVFDEIKENFSRISGTHNADQYKNPLEFLYSILERKINLENLPYLSLALEFDYKDFMDHIKLYIDSDESIQKKYTEKTINFLKGLSVGNGGLIDSALGDMTTCGFLQSFFTHIAHHANIIEYTKSSINEIYKDKGLTWLERKGVLISRVLEILTSEMSERFNSVLYDKIGGDTYIYSNGIFVDLINYVVNRAGEGAKELPQVNKLSFLKMLVRFVGFSVEENRKLPFTSEQLKTTLELVKGILNEQRKTTIAASESIDYLFILGKAGLKLIDAEKELLVIDPAGEFEYKLSSDYINQIIDLIKWRSEHPNQSKSEFLEKCYEILELRKNNLKRRGSESSLQESKRFKAEDCLPQRSKREAESECQFTWKDVDEFNTEKDEKRDLSKIKIDSEKFLNYIKDLQQEKQSQLIQLASGVKITGESQSLVNKLISNQKVISHLSRVGKISGIAMHGMMAKNVLADFLNGDYQGVAINVGFIAGGQGFAKVAQAASMKGLEIASEGKLLLGRSLGAASPFLARGTSAFVVYDLVNQVKAFKNGTEEALVGVVGDSIYLGVEAAEIGIEIAEAFEVLEGVSSVTGPIGATIGAVVFVGTDIYMAVKRVDKIDQIIHLTGKEKFVEGLCAFIGMQPENHIQELLQEKQVSNQLARQGLEYLKQHSDIQSYVFPTGKSVVDSCRKVPYKTSECSSGGLGGRCLKTHTVTRYAEECTTKFEVDLDSTVQLDRKRTDIKWSRAKPDNPRGGYLFCLPQGNYSFAPSYGSYLCKNVIGITDLSTNKTGNYTLINLGEGEDYAKGFIDSPNIFVVNNGSKRYFGGNKDDIFILQGSSITGYFYGEGGVNTLDLTSFAPEEGSIDVKLHIGQVEDHYRKNFFGMSGINKFLGRKAKADQVFITCDSDASDIKFVDGQSGSEEFVDHINIHDKDCAYEMQVVVGPNTVIYNRALEGDFHYIVPYALGSTKVDFIYTAEALNLNNTFAFEYEPAQIKNVDVRNINVLNKTSHIITFNFSPMSDKEFNITISGASNPSYRLGNNTEIKVGNKGNLYMLENTNKSVDEIIKDYLVVANRLNRMSFFIQSLLSNETVAIGSGNYEVIHNNPLQKSHLVGNGGENVYVIDSESKKFEVAIPEVIIYDLDIESSVDTIDLRNLVRQVRGKLSNQDHFQLKVLKSANDLLLKATVVEVKPTEDSSVSKMRKHEYCTVRLKDGVNWYNKTHVIVDNAPMKINLDNNEWSLKPQPLMFEKDKEVIIVTSQDIEENTELITPRRAGNYSFVSDHGSDLIVTNAFDVNVAKNDLCTIVLSKFYEELKMSTLSIKFADKEIILKEHQKEISTARDVNVVKKEHKDQVYNGVFNHTKSSPEVIMLSDQPVMHRHRHSRHREQIRHRRSTSSGIRSTGWINDLFGWVRDSVGGLLSSKSVGTSNTTSSISQVDAQIDVNSTIMLLDLLIRKVTGRKYISTVDQSISSLEAQGYALNITNRFEKVLNKTAIKSGISVTNLNFDPVVVQSAIIGKIINGKFSEIAKTLYSFAKEACPEFKQTDKFLDHLKSNLEEVLAKEETMILQQKVEKPSKVLGQEVSRKVQLSKKPDTFLNGTSVVQGISRAIN
ncbi:latrotoxin-related protein [Wolbachia endosymbiont (group A) of Philonthus cognatus]|uniref:latrotoxin-related protein n=1 Tax=Wolbachia endosymbiont (group A) of Philonthus cognatus TaxID=2954046 RepID=UPI00222F10F5|nr:latrotoxin-related protein [Wolbachia endosymbiont (group A) of Philonthus cognatus]